MSKNALIAVWVIAGTVFLVVMSTLDSYDRASRGEIVKACFASGGTVDYGIAGRVYCARKP